MDNLAIRLETPRFDGSLLPFTVSLAVLFAEIVCENVPVVEDDNPLMVAFAVPVMICT